MVKRATPPVDTAETVEEEAQLAAVDAEEAVEEADDIRSIAARKIQRHEPTKISNVKMLVYGVSGAGKTVFASTWPKVLFVQAEKGMLSVTQEGVDYWPCDSWQDILEVMEYLASGEHPYRTVVFDSINEIMKLSMDWVIGNYNSRGRQYDTQPTQSDWGKSLDDIAHLIRFIKSLPMNVVVIATNTNRVHEDDIIEPTLSGKQTGTTLCRFMDVIGYLYTVDTDQGVQRMLAVETPIAISKDRTRCLPAVIPDPTYKALNHYWKKNRAQVAGQNKKEE
jgi:GTPase SAR1 family protein